MARILADMAVDPSDDERLWSEIDRRRGRLALAQLGFGVLGGAALTFAIIVPLLSYTSELGHEAVVFFASLAVCALAMLASTRLFRRRDLAARLLGGVLISIVPTYLAYLPFTLRHLTSVTSSGPLIVGYAVVAGAVIGLLGGGVAAVITLLILVWPPVCASPAAFRRTLGLLGSVFALIAASVLSVAIGAPFPTIWGTGMPLVAWFLLAALCYTWWAARRLTRWLLPTSSDFTN